MKKDFLIDSIDPLGQGVSKNDEGVTFIKKTLPGETGIAEIITQKKGVTFAKLTELKTKSPDRISPACPHFAFCNGCDFLHTTYEKEVEYKIANIKRSLAFLNVTNITFHDTKKRIGYRNRLQLHYDRKKNVIGFMGPKNEIVEIKNCIVANDLIQKKLQEIMLNSSWQNLVQKEPHTGHIELYAQNGRVQVECNQNYAHGGFTQVNEAMNEELRQFVTDYLKKAIHPDKIVYDMFGGNGNLTKKIPNPTLVVDYYKSVPPNIFHQTFMHLDLYQPRIIKQMQHFYPANPELIIFDPPRSGVKNLGEYLTAFNPKKFIYIACEFSSFTRDVKPILSDYNLEEVHIFDLFPGTHHFETIGLFTKRS